MAERVCVIVNPAAGRGRGARMLPEIISRFGERSVTDIRTSGAKGDEARIAEGAIAEGFTTLVAVGGDGTTSNVANAIVRSGKDVRLAVMPAGTGNDFAKLLGTATVDVATVARLCAEPSTNRIDVGRVEDVYFLNSCGFGFDVAVLEGIASNSWLRGSSVYVYAALTNLFTFRGISIGVRSTASVREPQLHMLLVLANASRFGGTFEIAPGASATDGLLDAVSILDVSPMKRIAILAAAVRGRHETYRECVRESAREFEVSFAAAPVYETDGEMHRARSAILTVTSCQAALRVVTCPSTH